MAEPIRERVMAAMATQLATITAGVVVYGAKSVEYLTTPSLVTRALLWVPDYDQPLVAGNPATQLDAGPVIGVVRSSGSTFERLTHVDPAGPQSAGFEHHQRITIWGYAKFTASVAVSTWLERLWQDIVECLFVDPTFGGLALSSYPDGPVDTDDGALEPLGYIAQDWLVVV